MRLPADNGGRTAGMPALWLNLLLISGTWGSSFLFAKLITASVPPFAFAASRGFIAMAALLVWLALRRRARPAAAPRPRRGAAKKFGHMIVLGTTNGWLANVLTAIAVSRVQTGTAAMLQATVPLMVCVLAHVLFAEERFRLNQVVGVATGLAGILLIVGPMAVFGGSGSLIGVGAMLLAALSYACGTIYGRHIASEDPAALACGQQACGAVVAGVVSFMIEPAGLWGRQPAEIWVLLAVIGVLCSAVPTVVYLRLLARAPSVSASLVAYLQPVWAILLGWAFLGEVIRAQALLGTGFVVIAIVLATRPRGLGMREGGRMQVPRPLTPRLPLRASDLI